MAMLETRYAEDMLRCRHALGWRRRKGQVIWGQFGVSRQARDTDFCDQIRDLDKNRNGRRRREKAEMRKRDRFVGRRLLLMGSKKYRAKKLPARVARKIDEAIACKMKIIVGEVPGACRLYQDYLKSKNYTDVVVGHAKSMRYNVGNWKTKQYGNSVTEREHSMIRACSSAIIIWTDNSGVIAENLELLKRLGKPTFLYEYYTKRRVAKAGWLDPERIYDPYYFWKERMRRQKKSIKKKA